MRRVKIRILFFGTHVMIRIQLALALALFTATAHADDSPFSDGYPPHPATGVSGPLSPTATVDGDSIQLANRGVVVSKTSYPQGFTLAFDWKWIEGSKVGAYEDVLTVAFRTDGKLNAKWSHEIVEALVATFQAHDGKITIERRLPGKPGETLAAIRGITFKRNQVYQIEVRDDEELEVSVNQGRIAYLKIPAPQRGKDSKVAIYNREAVAGVRKVSKLSHVSLKAVKPE